MNLVARDFYLPIKASDGEPPQCEIDADCTTSPYVKFVQSREDCYCPLCPQPISVAAAERNFASWQKHCRDFGYPSLGGDSKRLICPAILCVAPPPVGCVDNQCAALEETPLILGPAFQ